MEYNSTLFHNIIIFFPQCTVSPFLSVPQFDNDLMSIRISRLEQVLHKQKLVCLLALAKITARFLGLGTRPLIVSSSLLLPSTPQLQFMAHNKRYLGNSVYHIVHYVDGFGHANSSATAHCPKICRTICVISC